MKKKDICLNPSHRWEEIRYSLKKLIIIIIVIVIVIDSFFKMEIILIFPLKSAMIRKS